MTVAVLDDLESRPGSTASLLRTVIGLYLRRLGGWLSSADLVALLEHLDVPAGRTRTTVARLKQKGLLLTEARDGRSGYAVNPEAVGMLAKGDRRIFAARSMQPGDPWCLISFSLPEEQRQLRHQLRKRLQGIGCGTVSAALWICPDFLADEVEDIFGELGIRASATLFRTDRPRVAGELRDAVAEWWDLGAIERLHLEAIAGLSALLEPTDETVDSSGSTEASGAEAFARYIRGVDVWRPLPYLDPGLPADLLPADWPGARSTALFAELTARYAEASAVFVAESARADTTQPSKRARLASISA
ncbi:regulator [Herbiconiux sp. CPCC 205763]|uniref:Regulator n=1 Tax=Herbiconiux aconitum TaxID=2970913 RepID=A0ABT2GUY6_9MICO|nr:PaaX family transcriptional regulator C-terminal domain-containing protein [Herbiconiux aconitum]MCS5718744.1 regulator [Herbiconiux aconitum]